MSQFLIFREHLEKAIQSCLEATASHRDTFEDAEVPATVIEDVVAKHITPLCGKDNTLNIVTVQGRPDWRKNATEVVFRRTLLKIAKDSTESQERFNQTVDCLDIVLHCSEPGVDYLDNVIPLTLIEELLDVHTTMGCEKLFSFVEKRKARITVDLVPGRGKGLVLLRMCNELLRRLSKEINTVFCGRILMFLANTFPLGERSGVNLRGDFNNDMVAYDNNEEVDSDPSLTEEQKSFYKTFWATRVFFANPPSIFTGDNFDQFQKGTDLIASKFQVITEKEAEVLGARKSELIGLKRQRADTAMEEDPTPAAELLAEINRDFQFPRLLSSRKLLDLEMEDCRFRRNVIVQYLIIFQYLNGFSPEEKERTAALLSARGTTKQTMIQPNATLTEDQMAWIKKKRDIMTSFLRATKPHGNLFTDIILTIIANERHWILWKASGCPPFEKPAISMADLEKSWNIKKFKLSAPHKRARHPRGNFAASEIYKTAKEPLSDFMSNRPHLPSPIDVINQSLEDLDDSLDTSQIRFDMANGALLQSTRLLYKNHPPLVRQVYASKKEVYRDMRERAKQDEDEPTSPTSTEEQSKSSQPALLDFKVNDTITEDHVQAEIETLKRSQKLIIDETSMAIDDDSNTTNANGTTAATTNQ